MKSVMVCVMFMVTGQSYGQPYFAFPDSNAIWHTYVGRSTSWVDYDFYHYYLQGDTVIGSQVYQKLYCWGDGCEGYSHIGAIREDSAKRVYFYGNLHALGVAPDTIQEYLLYHFGLAVAEVVALWRESPSDIVSVHQIDSVVVGSQYRKRYQIVSSETSDSDYWIEGIGSAYGLFGPYSIMFEHDWSLYCFEQDGRYLYPDTTNQGCIGTGVAEFSAATFVAYPNPTEGLLNVVVPSLTSNSQLSITNSLGNTQWNEPLPIGNNHLPLDLNVLSPGIYVICISDGQHTWRAIVVKL
jgi:hypothetical protein